MQNTATGPAIAESQSVVAKATAEAPPPLQALIVLGMHRSGTSALAGVLAQLGVDAGPNLQDGNEFNTRGYWEHRDVVRIHDELLRQLGSDWQDTRALPLGWEQTKAAQDARTALLKLLQQNFGDSPLWLVKDPRTCRLLPLWRSILAELGVEAKYLLTFRHPAEVAASLAQRDRMSASRSLQLWLQHVIEIERHTRGESRAVIRYDTLLADWRGTLTAATHVLGIELPLLEPERQVRVEEFLSPQLRHQKPEDSPCSDAPRLYALALSVFDACSQAQNDLELTHGIEQQGAPMSLFNEIVQDCRPSTLPPTQVPAPSSGPSLKLAQGIQLLDSCETERAYEVLAQALAEAPQNADVLVQLGRLALMTEMSDAAIDFFLEAITNTPNGLEKVHRYGSELAQSGQTDASRLVGEAIVRSMNLCESGSAMTGTRSASGTSCTGNAAAPWQEPPSTDVKKVYEVCSRFDDNAWQQIILASVNNSTLDGIRLPGFADEGLQRNTVGSAGQQALHEGKLFYEILKKSMHQCGGSLTAESKILDFGCGWGRYLRYFLKDTLANNLYGVDVDPLMVQTCKQTFPYGNFAQVKPFPPSQFEDNQFNLIFAYSVFSHLSAPAADAWIAEFSRLLAPGGVLVVTTQGRDFVNYCQQIRDGIRATGRIEHPWHDNLARAFVDRDACLAAYDRGEHLFAPTGGGDVRPSTFYGEALVPRGHAERVWGQYLHFQDFVDDSRVLPQAFIVMHKPSGVALI